MPIFFNIYVNDIVPVSDKFKFALFADDCNILYSSRNYEFVENTVNNELDNVNQWLTLVNYNRLSINLSKTDFMVFS